MRTPLVLVATLATLALAPPPAVADHGEPAPPTRNLVLAGIGMGVPTYVLGVTIHEGTHALVAKAFGAEIIRMQLLPGRHPRTGRFYFGYVQYRGRLPTGQRVLFLLSPKIVDVVMLGGYAALVGTDTLPDNHYGQLALAVVATGFWVDFAKDIAAFFRPHDVNMALDKLGMKGPWKKLPYYLAYAGLAAVGSIAIVEGYRRIFDDGTPAAAPRAVTLPVFTGRF